VEFIHFVELLYDSTMKTPHGHLKRVQRHRNNTDRGSQDGYITNELLLACRLVQGGHV
jgi:hypothetical protein